MPESTLLHELLSTAATRGPSAPALSYLQATMEFGTLHDSVFAFASGLVGLGLARSDRVGIYLEKRFETVIASFGAPAAGACSCR